MPRAMKVKADEHAYLIHKATGNSLNLNWNPNQFQRTFKVNWSRQQIPGLSHQRSQYINTENQKVEFDIVVDGLDVGGASEVEKHRRFLESLCFPRQSKRIEGAGPSPVIIGQPNYLHITVLIDEIQFTDELFYSNGACRRFTAKIKVAEELSRRRTSREVRELRRTPKRVYQSAFGRLADNLDASVLAGDPRLP